MCDDGRGGNKTMCNIVDHHAKSFERSHTNQRRVARLGKHDFVNRLKSFGTQNRVANRALNRLASRRLKRAISHRRNADCVDDV